MAEPVLERVAAAVADREAVDWDGVDARLRDPHDRSRAAALRTIANVAERASDTLTTSVARPSTVAVPLLAKGVMILALLQALIAVGTPPEWGGAGGPIPALMVLGAGLVFAVAGSVLVWAGRRDARAVDLGGFFLCSASAASLRFLPTEAPFPWLAALSVYVHGLLPDAFLAYFLWRFAGEFPRLVRFERHSWTMTLATRASAVLGGALFVANAVVRTPGLMIPQGLENVLAPLQREAGAYWASLSALCLGALLTAWWRARRAEESEKARFRWFAGGLAAGLLPLFSVVLLEGLFPAVARFLDQPVVRARCGMLLYGLLLAVPVTTAYAVVAHRLLDVRLVVRRALAIALARVTLLGLGLVPTIMVAAKLYLSRELPLESVWQERDTAAWALTATCAWVLLARRRPLLRRIEGWLVGSRSEPTAVLASFSRDSSKAMSPEGLGRLLADRLAEQFAVTRTSLLLRDPDGRPYRAVSGTAPPLDANGAIALLAEASPEPLVVAPGEPRALYDWMLEEDRRWVVEADASLVAPLADREGRVTGLLAVGPSRSGLIHQPGDRRAIAALAATAALALDRIGTPPAPVSAVERERAAGECNACGSVAPQPGGECSCGGRFSPAAIPYSLQGKFQLEGSLGRGGMGVVYRARDIALGRSVALKTLPRVKADALLRLRQEARSMAGFVHPNLALIFGAESWDGVPVLVVEYLAGGTLAKRLPPPMQPAEALELAATLAGALSAMHDQGHLHRDVKPQNIAFTADGTPKLLDFGLAHLSVEADLTPKRARFPDDRALTDRLTHTGGIVGTPLYLSPEVLSGSPPSPAQDLWSLHLVLWECLAGSHPLAGLPREEAFRCLSRGELPVAKRLPGSLPSPVTELLETALHRDPRQRPSTAAAARRAILRVQKRM